MSPDEEATWLVWKYHYDRVTSVVSVVSPVVARIRRHDRRYCKQRGKKENQDLLRFCSSNSSLNYLRPTKRSARVSVRCSGSAANISTDRSSWIQLCFDHWNGIRCLPTDSDG